jgi:hypothetical protein
MDLNVTGLRLVLAGVKTSNKLEPEVEIQYLIQLKFWWWQFNVIDAMAKITRLKSS